MSSKITRLPDVAGATPMERLVQVVQQLSHAHSIEEIMAVVRVAARELTGADGATFVLKDGDQCYYAEENAIAPLWKGKRFPMSACVSGWAMINAKSAVIEDIYKDPRIPADAYRPTFVKSLAMVPIRRTSPIGAIGNYWATQHKPTEAEVGILQALADTTSVAVQNAELYGQLQAKIATLRLREARIREQRDAMDVFTRSLAHDLKEPVRSIRSFAHLITDEPGSVDEKVKLIDRIRDAGDRMAMLVDTVFEYTQLDDAESMPKERFDLREAAQAAIKNLADLIAARGAQVACGILPVVNANRKHAVQLFENLIANAVGHSAKPVRVQITAERADGAMRICVRDDGPGIEKHQQAKIFEPFRRLTHDRTHAGLGLATCRKIVALHGGVIECESEIGHGAKFYFTFPDETPVEQLPEAEMPFAAVGAAS
jgi:two-component system CheB/CheR fusion protein